VRKEGLLRSRTISYGCQQGGHVAIAETPEIAATFGNVILVLDLDGLPGVSDFYGGEARVHGDIPPERISLYDGPPVVGSRDGHIDPGKTPRMQHPACVDDEFDLSTYREESTPDPEPLPEDVEERLANWPWPVDATWDDSSG
jgi:hypothetical protein